MGPDGRGGVTVKGMRGAAFPPPAEFLLLGVKRKFYFCIFDTGRYSLGTDRVLNQHLFQSMLRIPIGMFLDLLDPDHFIIKQK